MKVKVLKESKSYFGASKIDQHSCVVNTSQRVGIERFKRTTAIIIISTKDSAFSFNFCLVFSTRSSETRDREQSRCSPPSRQRESAS